MQRWHRPRISCVGSAGRNHNSDGAGRVAGPHAVEAVFQNQAIIRRQPDSPAPLRGKCPGKAWNVQRPPRRQHHGSTVRCRLSAGSSQSYPRAGTCNDPRHSDGFQVAEQLPQAGLAGNPLRHLPGAVGPHFIQQALRVNSGVVAVDVVAQVFTGQPAAARQKSAGGAGRPSFSQQGAQKVSQSRSVSNINPSISKMTPFTIVQFSLCGQSLRLYCTAKLPAVQQNLGQGACIRRFTAL